MNFGAGELERADRDPASSCGLSRPVYFKRQVGRVSRSWIGSPFAQPISRPRKQSKKLGISYEKKVSAQLSQIYGDLFLPQICFQFEDSSRLNLGKSQSCYIDGILFSRDWKSAILVEIKLRHSADAFHQLWNFYRPIVQKAFPSLEIGCLEICRWYDPSIVLPKKPAFVQAAHESVRECFHPIQIVRLT